MDLDLTNKDTLQVSAVGHALITMYQPYTTDTTRTGLIRARNAKRMRLWTDDAYAHKWLCHDDMICRDGCDARALPDRLALYESDIEPT